MKFIKSLKNRINTDIRIIASILSLTLLVVDHFFGRYLIGTLEVLNIILWTLILFFVMVAASFATLKALFIVAAEISLLIFLAQSYCSIPDCQRSIESDGALKNILSFGLIYIICLFAISLWELIQKNYKEIKNDKPLIGKITVVGLFVIFTFWFIWEIYLVTKPIISDLCVYK